MLPPNGSLVFTFSYVCWMDDAQGGTAAVVKFYACDIGDGLRRVCVEVNGWHAEIKEIWYNSVKTCDMGNTHPLRSVHEGEYLHLIFLAVQIGNEIKCVAMTSSWLQFQQCQQLHEMCLRSCRAQRKHLVN